MTLSNEQLDAIRKRAEAATEGKWRFHNDNEGTEYFPFWVIGGENVEEGEWFAELHVGIKADAEFIAHAREDVPALLEEIERLTIELQAYKKYSSLYVADRVNGFTLAELIERKLSEGDSHD